MPAYHLIYLYVVASTYRAFLHQWHTAQSQVRHSREGQHEAGASRGSLENTDFAAGFESAIADIQLLGTVEQVRLAKNLATSIARRDPFASAGPLLLSLRDELREHLGLQALGEEPLHFRLKVGTESRA